MLESLSLPLALGWAHWFFIIPLCVLSIFLTLLILVQRGRGGGLTGALGGMGGQSAFGAKAGDLFTKITIITAMIWILFSMGALKLLHKGQFDKSSGGSTATKQADKKGDATKGDTTDPKADPKDEITPENTPAPKSSTPSDTPASDTPAKPADAPATSSEAPKSSTPAEPPATPEKSDK